MPFLGKAFRFGLQVIAGVITDLFGRTTTTSLGTTDTGQTWNAVRGTWYANGSQAQSDDSASSYPIAAINTNSTNVEVSAAVTNGTGVAFWVTDSGSWWGMTSYWLQTTSTFQCNPYSCFQFSANGVCNGGPSFGTGGNLSTSVVSSCSELQTYQSNTTCGGRGLISWSCTGQVTTCYQTCTSTTDQWYMRLMQYISNSVGIDSIYGDLGANPGGIKVTTSGNVVTAQAYSDSSLSTPLGGQLVINSLSNPNKGTSHGIIKSTTPYNQQSTVDNFSLRNT